MKFLKPIHLVSLLLVTSCAKQGFPPGGPEDRTPPEVVRTEPDQGQIRVPAGKEVTIWFSEGVRASALSDAIFFSPNPGEGVRFKISGKKITVRFPKPFLDSSTVVVALGTGIQDYQGNAMKSSFTLAFSTGSSLDQGQIRGKVYGSGSALGLDVWAYRLQNAADPNPMKTKSDYAVQCQEGGEFHFSHLSPGRYRLFAVRDRARDRLYQPVEDEIGIASRDAVLFTENRQADSLFFRMSREDTLGPSLNRALAQNRNQIVLQFDETVLMNDPWFKTIRTEKPDSALIRGAFVDPSNTKQIFLLTEPQKAKRKYSFSIHGVTDPAGNPVDSVSQKIQVESTDKPDTTLPRLASTQPQNGDRSVHVNETIRLVFNEPMDTAQCRKGIVLSDSSGRNIGCNLVWETPASLDMVPERPLGNHALYRLSLRASVLDFAGRALKDTVIKFHTLDMDTLSEISGEIADQDESFRGTLPVSIRQAGALGLVYRRTLSRPGPYRFDSILPGRYILECYRDMDKNNRYDFGRAFPFKYAECFAVYPDTVVVRSRWPNEGNNLVLP